MCAWTHKHILHMFRCLGSPEEVIDPLGLELQKVMSHLTLVLENKLQSSGGVASTLNH